MAKDNWSTPWDFIDNIKAEFPLVLDVATDGTNAKCDHYLTDSLNIAWAPYVKMIGGGYVWCNPPYSDPSPWVKKIAETLQAGVGSLLLVNAATSSAWYHDAMHIAAERWTFKGRIAFIDPDTGLPGQQNDRSQEMFVFKPEHSGPMINKSVSVSDYQTHRRNYRGYLNMLTIVEFNPMTHNRMPTGRYLKMQGTRATLPAQLAMMGINLQMSEKWILGYKLFVYQNDIPVGSDWIETPLSELVN